MKKLVLAAALLAGAALVRANAQDDAAKKVHYTIYVQGVSDSIDLDDVTAAGLEDYGTGTKCWVFKAADGSKAVVPSDKLLAYLAEPMTKKKSEDKQPK